MLAKGGAFVSVARRMSSAVGPRNGRSAEEQLVEDDAEREHVGARVHPRAGPLLRRHVAWRAHRRRHRDLDRRRLAQPGLATELLLPREPEVEQLQVPAGGEHDVLGLEVAVDDAARVQRREPLGHLHRQRQALRRRHRVAHPRAQGRAAHVLHGDEERALVLPDVVDAGNAFVLHLRREPGLAQEAFAVGRVLVVLRFVEHLERDAAAQQRVRRRVDRAHAAAPEALVDLVAPAGAPANAGGHVARGVPGRDVGDLAQEIADRFVGALGQILGRAVADRVRRNRGRALQSIHRSPPRGRGRPSPHVTAGRLTRGLLRARARRAAP